MQHAKSLLALLKENEIENENQMKLKMKKMKYVLVVKNVMKIAYVGVIMWFSVRRSYYVI